MTEPPEGGMQTVSFLFFNIILPIFIPIGAGYLLQRQFPLNVSTLTKIQFYIFIPALLFTTIYQTELNSALLRDLVLANLVLFVLLWGACLVCTRLLKLDSSKRSAFINSVCFYNSGNYCIPLVQLMYHTAFAFSIQIVVMLIQQLLTNTIGVMNASSSDRSWKKALLENFRMPMTYAVLIAVLCRWLSVEVPKPLWTSLDLMAQGLVPTALITLGAQLASTRLYVRNFKVLVSNGMRLLVGPLIATLVCLVWGISGVMAQVMVICAAAPSAVNTVLLAIEYKSDPDFASQTVFLSTLLSAVTMPIVIALVRFL
ncbi:AEC family transporter [Tolumonas lignilytica]|uniref:AEC family transporter n=1 Tax=Tolumonas lignilytica TaxID=1283284 RepID=UPI000462FD11|nr:AEC family transporter [Tolumonas lignilytica]